VLGGHGGAVTMVWFGPDSHGVLRIGQPDLGQLPVLLIVDDSLRSAR
jgi:hypothetical protein